MNKIKNKEAPIPDKRKNRDRYKNYKIILVICGIALFTALLYRNSLKAEFLSYDDTENVVDNVLIQQLSFKDLPRFFSSSHLYMYAPLTFISYAIDYKVDGLNPFYFKLTNLILHLVNIVFVYILSFQLLKRINLSVLVTFLFAIHPVNADTISWISTRSNLLFTLFFLLSVILYMSYTRKNNYWYLFFSVLSCLFSVLSKSSGVMLPFIFLLIDYFQKRKIGYKLAIEKIPYLVVCLLVGILAIYFRTDTGTTQTLAGYNLFDRFILICYSLIAYLLKALFPFYLSEIYSYPLKSGGFLPFWYYLAPLLILAVTIVIWRIKKSKNEIIFGILFFLFTILITQFVLLEDGYMANRYAYLPYIGLYFVMAKLSDMYVSGYHKARIYLTILFAILVIIFSWTTYQRSMVWMTTLSLFNHVIDRSPDAAFAYNSRGIAKYTGNDYAGALSDYDQAIRLNPRYAGAFYNRGLIYNDIKQFDRAFSDYSRAIELNPDFASSYTARGILEMDVFLDDSLAMADYNAAIRINPSFAQAYYNRGILELRMRQIENACRDFRMVKKLGYSKADDLIDRFCK